MKIHIENMRRGKGRQVAIYDAAFDGWRINCCIIVQRDDGDLSALPPVIRDGIRAIEIAARYWPDFLGASLVAYRKWLATQDGAVAISAEAETCELAGI